MHDLHNGATRYIMKLSSVIRTALDAFVDGTSVTPMEARALLFISTASNAIYQKDIEQEYGLSRATVSELMQNMEQKGMIQRKRDTVDRRRKCIIVSESFQPMVNDMIEQMSAVEEKLAFNIREEDLEVFLDVIEHMSKNAPPKQD